MTPLPSSAHMHVCFALAAAGLFLAGQAVAAPVTIGFSGTLVLPYTPHPSDTVNGNYTGKPFAGTLTFDVAGQPHRYENYFGNVRDEVHNYSGCGSFRDGTCSGYAPYLGSPVILQATFSGEFGEYSLSPDATGGGTHSGLVRNQSSYFNS